MPTAFIFLRVKLGTIDQALYDMTQILPVQEVHVVYGQFDIIAKVKASTMHELKHIIMHSICQAPNIQSTRTLIVMSAQ